MFKHPRQLGWPPCNCRPDPLRDLRDDSDSKADFEVNAGIPGHCVTGIMLQILQVRKIRSLSALLVRGVPVLAEYSARLRNHRRRESGTLRGGLKAMNGSLSAER
jgi:hypothetical protein